MSHVMDIEVIASNERGRTQNEWLQSYHSFSFGNYHNLKRLNFGTLRVLNDDIIQPGKGFGTHSHDNMEIVTIVLDGAVEHQDSMGNHGYVQAGEVQRMTAGKGVQHSESNASKDRPLHLLQIWVYPKERDLPPSYEQKMLDPENLKNTLFPVVSGEPSEMALLIHQDATFYMGHFDKGKAISYKLLSKKHGAYLFVIEGSIALGDKTLGASDSAQITKTEQIEIQALKNTKILLIEVGVNTL